MYDKLNSLQGEEKYSNVTKTRRFVTLLWVLSSALRKLIAPFSSIMGQVLAITIDGKLFPLGKYQ